MRRPRDALADHAVDLSQLIHEVPLCVEAAGGVDDHDVGARATRLRRPRRRRRRPGRLPTATRRSRPPPGRPRSQLLPGCPERIGRADDARPPRLVEVPGDLADRRRLAGTVDPAHQDHRWRVRYVDPRGRCSAGHGEPSRTANRSRSISAFGSLGDGVETAQPASPAAETASSVESSRARTVERSEAPATHTHTHVRVVSAWARVRRETSRWSISAARSGSRPPPRAPPRPPASTRSARSSVSGTPCCPAPWLSLVSSGPRAASRAARSSAFSPDCRTESRALRRRAAPAGRARRPGPAGRAGSRPCRAAARGSARTGPARP